MNRWSLKVKVGAYAALLTVVSLGVTAAVIIPWFHYHLVGEVDASLRDDARELSRDLRYIRGAPPSSTRELPARVIPVALRERYLVVLGPGGFEAYRSPSMKDASFPTTEEGIRTGEILGSTCRIGVFEASPYTFLIAADLAPVRATERKLWLGFVLALPAVGLVVFLGGIWLGRKAVAPVADLTEAAERISTERPKERLPMPPAKDEIARLTEVLNESFDRLQASYDTARRFSADASHQLKTPVSVLRVGLDELRKCEYLKLEEEEEVRALLQQTRRLGALIEDLLLLAQVDSGRLKMASEAFELGPLVEAALDDLGALTEEAGIEVESEIEPSLRAEGDPRRVALVLQNLVENAAKYTPEGGRVRLTAVRDNGVAHVVVANSGPSITPADQARIFERFHRGSRMGENVRGQGLGLNIARELARAHGGDLRLLRSENDWTEFLLELPAGGGTVSRG